ncbi:transposase [Methylobacterium sp. IF7SW-B2]|nr:transposase [Methylobacterium ajmalii]MBK3408455.1 transposase [Methylobacterium ajmalii]MBK3425851.1 transposase [Methylobacterium ajmalii]
MALRHSVGVQRQYCGQLGKKANCQALVSLTLARGEVPIPVALRLFLPDSWVDDPVRRRTAGMPDDVSGRPKWQIALDEVDRLRDQGVRFGCVLGDAEYGKVAAFRHALDARGLCWALGLPPTQKVFAADVTTAMPAPTRAGAAIKARWSCEQAHQQLKEELGLDHFEARSWIGLHNHALLCQIAFAFLQSLRVGEKKVRVTGARPAASADAARGQAPCGRRAPRASHSVSALPPANPHPHAAMNMAE